MLGSLRFRLSLIFIGLAVIPTILVSAIFGFRAFATLEEQSLAMQRKVADRVSGELGAFIRVYEHEMNTLDSVYELGTANPGTQRAILDTLLEHERTYQEIALIDVAGREQYRTSRFDISTENAPTDWLERDEFQAPLAKRETFYGEVHYNKEIREPLITISRPLVDEQDGQVAYIVVATLKFQSIWDFLASVELSANEDVYIADQAGRIVAHRNPTLVINETVVNLPPADGRAQGLAGPDVFVARDILDLGGKTFTVVAEQPADAALGLATDTMWSMLYIAAASLLLASLLVVLTVHRTVRPIEELSASAEAISYGDFTRHVEAVGRDEVFQLARAFDSMRLQLRRSLNTLETEITIRRETEEKLQQAVAELVRSNAELEQFAYVASHDLQEPLRKIQAFGSRLWSLQADRFDDQGRDYLERMQSAAGRMQTMIEDLLALSRVASGAQEFAPVDLGQTANDILLDLEARLEQTGGRVDIGDLPTIDANPSQMRQLFLNLIGNGLKFHRHGVPPQVKVSSMVVQGNKRQLCQIAVEDNGIGFDIKYLDRLFQPFQRLHGRGKYEGSGIGLAICRKVAELHSGGISAQSTPGQGATFVVTLPFTQTGGSDE